MGIIRKTKQYLAAKATAAAGKVADGIAKQLRLVLHNCKRLMKSV